MSQVPLTKSALSALQTEILREPHNSICSWKTEDGYYYTVGYTMTPNNAGTISDIADSLSSIHSPIQEGHESVARAAMVGSITAIYPENEDSTPIASSTVHESTNAISNLESISTAIGRFNDASWWKKLALLLVFCLVGKHLIGPCLCNAWSWIMTSIAILAYPYPGIMWSQKFEESKTALMDWFDLWLARIKNSALGRFVLLPWWEAQMRGYKARYQFAYMLFERTGIKDLIVDDSAFRMGRGIFLFALWTCGSFWIPTGSTDADGSSHVQHTIPVSSTTAVFQDLPPHVAGDMDEIGEGESMEEPNDSSTETPRRNQELQYWSRYFFDPEVFAYYVQEAFAQDYVFLANLLKVQSRDDWDYAALVEAHLVTPTDEYGDNEFYARMVDKYWIKKGEPWKAIGIDYTEEQWDQMEKKATDDDRNRNKVTLPPQRLMSIEDEWRLNKDCADFFYGGHGSFHLPEDLDSVRHRRDYKIPTLTEKVIFPMYQSREIVPRWTTYRLDLPTEPFPNYGQLSFFAGHYDNYTLDGFGNGVDEDLPAIDLPVHEPTDSRISPISYGRQHDRRPNLEPYEFGFGSIPRNVVVPPPGFGNVLPKVRRAPPGFGHILPNPNAHGVPRGFSNILPDSNVHGAPSGSEDVVPNFPRAPPDLGGNALGSGYDSGNYGISPGGRAYQHPDVIYRKAAFDPILGELNLPRLHNPDDLPFNNNKPEGRHKGLAHRSGDSGYRTSSDDRKKNPHFNGQTAQYKSLSTAYSGSIYG